MKIGTASVIKQYQVTCYIFYLLGHQIEHLVFLVAIARSAVRLPQRTHFPILTLACVWFTIFTNCDSLRAQQHNLPFYLDSIHLDLRAVVVGHVAQ